VGRQLQNPHEPSATRGSGFNAIFRTAPYSKLTSLERDAARLEGERGQLISSIAETKVKIVQIDRVRHRA
jgi:hypothetical protein